MKQIPVLLLCLTLAMVSACSQERAAAPASPDPAGAVWAPEGATVGRLIEHLATQGVQGEKKTMYYTLIPGAVDGKSIVGEGVNAELYAFTQPEPARAFATASPLSDPPPRVIEHGPFVVLLHRPQDPAGRDQIESAIRSFPLR